jgi:hypothetical protein
MGALERPRASRLPRSAPIRKANAPRAGMASTSWPFGYAIASGRLSSMFSAVIARKSGASDAMNAVPSGLQIRVQRGSDKALAGELAGGCIAAVS